MKTLGRYLSGFFLRNFFLGSVGLTSLFLFQAVLGQILNSEYPPSQVIIYNLMDVPQILVQMTPPAVLIATALTLSGLGRTNELVACHAIGISLRQIVTILLSIVFMVSCFTLVLQDRILPPVYKKRTEYYWREMKKRQDFFLDVRKDKIWYRSKNLIYNLRTFDPETQTIHGMTIYTFDDDFNLAQVIEAQHAQFTPKGWKLKDGAVTVFEGKDSFPLTKKFSEKGLIIHETPKDFQEIEKEVDGLRLKELYRYIGRIRDSGLDTKHYEVKLHSRVSLSFIPMVMCILAIPFSVRTRREGGAARDLGICLGVTFFYWLFYSVGLSLGANGALPPWLAAWLPSFVFVALAVTLISKQQR